MDDLIQRALVSRNRVAEMIAQPRERCRLSNPFADGWPVFSDERLFTHRDTFFEVFDEKKPAENEEKRNLWDRKSQRLGMRLKRDKWRSSSVTRRTKRGGTDPSTRNWERNGKRCGRNEARGRRSVWIEMRNATDKTETLELSAYKEGTLLRIAMVQKSPAGCAIREASRANTPMKRGEDQLGELVCRLNVHILRARPRDATCFERKCLSGERAAVARETLPGAWISGLRCARQQKREIPRWTAIVALSVYCSLISKLSVPLRVSF